MNRGTLRSIRLLAGGLALLAAHGASVEAQRAERRWPLAPDGALKVYNFSGRVTVVGWERDTVAVTAELPKGVQLLGGGGADAIKIAVEGTGAGRAGAVALEVRVPRGAQVWVRGAQTDLEVRGLIGSVDLGTVSGSVRVSGTPRRLTAESMTGAVTIDASSETLRARTGSGDLTWRGSAADAQLATVSGAVVVTAGPIERARLETVTGTVRVESALRPDARLTVETHGGDVQLRLPARTPVRLDADAAEVAAPGMATRTRPADGRFSAPITWDFNLARGAATAPLVVVRSFTGRLRLDFSP